MRSFWIYLLLTGVFLSEGISAKCKITSAIEIPDCNTIAARTPLVSSNNPDDSVFAFYYSIYKDSTLVYSRLLFNGIHTENELRIQIAKAQFLKQHHDFLNAAACFAETDKEGITDSLKYFLFYEAGLCYYLTQNFEAAATQFTKMGEALSDTSLLVKSFPLQALIYNEMGDWNLSQHLLTRYIHYTELNTQNRKIKLIDSVYAKKCRPKLKSPQKAKLLNTLLPGLGFIYAGNIGEGLLNTGFQLTFLGLTGLGIYEHYYISSAFGTLSLFARFYNGGRGRVFYLTEKRNYLQKKEYNERLKTLILQL